MSKRKDCESCIYWVQGDQVLTTNVSNVGNCVFLTTQGSGFYDHPQHVPYWAKNLIQRTISWEGTHCPVHKMREEEN